LCDFTDKTLEWELSDQKLGGLLVTSDLTESDGSWLVSVGLLDTSGRWGALACSLGSKLLTGSLATSGLACVGVSACGWRCVMFWWGRDVSTRRAEARSEAVKLSQCDIAIA
jgi:hypothetical protein